MKKHFTLLVLALLFVSSGLQAQSKPAAKGTLFIIGGGTRSNVLMSQLVSTAALGTKDYVIVLPGQRDTRHWL